MPRVLVNVTHVDTATSILGSPVTSPICIAPTAMQRMAHVEGERATARAAAAANTGTTSSLGKVCSSRFSSHDSQLLVHDKP